jgi:CheY-like chemotaxis protein
MSDTILIAEDNEDDVELIRRAFEQCKVSVDLKFVADGESAISYVAGEGIYADRSRYPFPILMLLDLKLPRKSGLEVLEWMKRTSQLKRLPIVMLTSSQEEKQVNRAYDLGVNSYLTKPVEFTDLRDIVDKLHLYWVLKNVPPEISVVRESNIK